MEEDLQNINPHLSKHPFKRTLALESYQKGILSGDRSILAQAITLIESNNPSNRSLANQIIEFSLQQKRQTIRIAITGSPGVGKSTFIESLGMYLIKAGLKVAVLAIDPSSLISEGSILGDKTRMPLLSNEKNAFIRPTAAGKTLGGVAQNTRQSIILCEAAGYDVILIETVGVGQSETLVHQMVDFFLLLILPGAGDELQGIKRGIVEMADLVVVNKTDGQRISMAKQTQKDYKTALHLFPVKESKWSPPIMLASAIDNIGMEEIWAKIQHYSEFTLGNGFLHKRRKEQAKFWLHELILNNLKEQFYNHPQVSNEISNVESKVIEGELSPVKGAAYLLDSFKLNTKKD